MPCRRLIPRFLFSGILLLACCGIAAACPQCAGRSGASPGVVASLGAIIALPFAVVAAIVPFIRRGPAEPRT